MPCQQHVDEATESYVHAVERALESGRSERLGGIEQTQFLAAALVSAYNKERGDLAAELTEADRAQGKLVAPFVRTAPCPLAPAWRSSGVPELDQAALKWTSEGVTFLAAERDPKAVAATAKVPVRFTLH